MNFCVTVKGSPRVNALPSSSSSTWPEMSNKCNPVSLLPHHVYIYIYKRIIKCRIAMAKAAFNKKRALFTSTCLLQRVIEGKIKGGIEVTGRQGRRRRKLLDDLKERRGYSFEGGSSGSHYVESSLWKRLWTCRKTDY